LRDPEHEIRETLRRRQITIHRDDPFGGAFGGAFGVARGVHAGEFVFVAVAGVERLDQGELPTVSVARLPMLYPQALLGVKAIAFRPRDA